MESEIKRRTFKALKHPKGSTKRQYYNLNSLTSEYMPSYKYIAFVSLDSMDGIAHGQSFRTKTEAQQWINSKKRSHD